MFVAAPISVYRLLSWLVNAGFGPFSGGTRDASPLSHSRFPHFLPQALTSGWCLEEQAVSQDGSPGSAGALLPSLTNTLALLDRHGNGSQMFVLSAGAD